MQLRGQQQRGSIEKGVGKVARDVCPFQVLRLDDLGPPHQRISLLRLHLEMVRSIALLNFGWAKDRVPADLVVDCPLRLYCL